MNTEELVDVGDNDELEVDIELDDEESNITPVNPNIADQLAAPAEGEADEDKRTPAEKLEAYMEADEDAAEYGRDVRKRINKLTYEKHEAERREKAAIEYAQGVQGENTTLKSKQQHQDGVFLNEHKGRVTAQLEQAKQQYKEAHQSGDIDLITEANQNIAQYAAELTQADQTEARFKRTVSRPQAAPEPAYQPAPSAGYQEQAPRQIDAKAESWATKNEWFGNDSDMTDAAMQIHTSLVTQEGFLPTGDAYYTELDTRMRKNFPSKFGTTPKPRMGNGQPAVTPGGGGNPPARKPGKKNVRLSASQVAIAKKLGVPLEEYAKYV
tara:strand:- start:2470 stop:3444 length:975 start_codon:yes stop_codon:yes gene_type:complete